MSDQAKDFLSALTDASKLHANVLEQAAAFTNVVVSLANIGALNTKGKSTKDLELIIIGLASKDTLAGGGNLLFSQRTHLAASEAALHTLGNTLSTLQGAESMHYLRPDSKGWDVVTTRVHNLVNAFKENNTQFDDMTALVRPSCPEVDCIGLEAALGEMIATSERRKTLLNEIGDLLAQHGFDLYAKPTGEPVSEDERTAARAQLLGYIEKLIVERANFLERCNTFNNQVNNQRQHIENLERTVKTLSEQREGALQDRSHFEKSAFELAGKATELEQRNKVLAEANKSLTDTNRNLRNSNRQYGQSADFFEQVRARLAAARIITPNADPDATLLGLDRTVERIKFLEASTDKPANERSAFAKVRERLANLGNINPDASVEATVIGLDQLIERVDILNKLLERNRTESPYTEANGCACLLKHKSECLGTCSLPGKPKVEDTYFFGKLKEVLTGYSKPRATFDNMLDDVARLVLIHKDAGTRASWAYSANGMFMSLDALVARHIGNTYTHDIKNILEQVALAFEYRSKQGPAALLEASESMHSAIALRGDLIALLGRYGVSIDAHNNPQDILPAVHRALDAQVNSNALTGLAACFGRDDQDLAQAIGDALSGSFERLKEFGVRVTPITETSIKDTKVEGLRIDVGSGSVSINHPATPLKLVNAKLALMTSALYGINDIFAKHGYAFQPRELASTEYVANMLKNVNTAVEFYANIKSGKENTPVADQYNALVSVIEKLPGFQYTGDLPSNLQYYCNRAANGLPEIASILKAARYYNNGSLPSVTEALNKLLAKSLKKRKDRGFTGLRDILARNGCVTIDRGLDELLRTAEVLIERGTLVRDEVAKRGYVYGNATTNDLLAVIGGFMDYADKAKENNIKGHTNQRTCIDDICALLIKAGHQGNLTKYTDVVAAVSRQLFELRPSSGWLRETLNGLGYAFVAGTPLSSMLAAVEATLSNRKAYEKLADERLTIINELRSKQGEQRFAQLGPWLLQMLNDVGFGFTEGTSINKMIEVAGNVRDKYHAITGEVAELRGELVRQDDRAKTTLIKALQKLGLFFNATHSIEYMMTELEAYRARVTKTESGLRGSLLRLQSELEMTTKITNDPRKIEFQLNIEPIKAMIDKEVGDAVGKPLEMLMTLANKYGYRGPCNTLEGAVALLDQLLAEGKEEGKIQSKANAAIGAYLINELEHSALYKPTGTEADQRITLPNLVDDLCKALRRMPAKDAAIKKLQEHIDKISKEAAELKRVRDNHDNFVLKLRELMKIDGDFAGMLGAIERWLKNAPVTEQQKAELQAYAKTVRTLQEAEVIPKGANTPAPWLIADYVRYLINDLNSTRPKAAYFNQMRSMLINAGFGPIDAPLKETPDMLASLFNQAEALKNQPAQESPVNQMLFKLAEDIQQILKHWGFGPDNATSVLITERIESLAKFRAEFNKVIGVIGLPNTINSLEILCNYYAHGSATPGTCTGAMSSTCSNDMPPLPASVNCDFGSQPSKTGFVTTDASGKVISSFWLDEFTRFEPLGEIAHGARTSAPINVVRDFFDGAIDEVTSVPHKESCMLCFAECGSCPGIKGKKTVRHYVRYRGIYDLVEISLSELEAICTIQNAKGI
jgi:hypothetical protein